MRLTQFVSSIVNDLERVRIAEALNTQLTTLSNREEIIGLYSGPTSTVDRFYVGNFRSNNKYLDRLVDVLPGDIIKIEGKPKTYTVFYSGFDDPENGEIFVYEPIDEINDGDKLVKMTNLTAIPIPRTTFGELGTLNISSNSYVGFGGAQLENNNVFKIATNSQSWAGFSYLHSSFINFNAGGTINFTAQLSGSTPDPVILKFKFEKDLVYNEKF